MIIHIIQLAPFKENGIGQHSRLELLFTVEDIQAFPDFKGIKPGPLPFSRKQVVGINIYIPNTVGPACLGRIIGLQGGGHLHTSPSQGGIGTKQQKIGVKIKISLPLQHLVDAHSFLLQGLQPVRLPCPDQAFIHRSPDDGRKAIGSFHGVKYFNGIGRAKKHPVID